MTILKIALFNQIIILFIFEIDNLNEEIFLLKY